jgi:arabinofuranosyltransferase
MAVAAAAIVVIKSAWICDDAFITYRTLDNLVTGHGLRWNVAERVQTYTHPLWLALNAPAYAAARSAYFSGLFVSLTVTVAAVSLFVFGLARAWPSVVLGLLALIGSRAFVDYSTSGLENPLTHLLLFAFLAMFMRTSEFTARRVTWLGLIAALTALNRLDALLLLAPCLGWVVATSRRRARTLGAIALGFVPLAAWLAFSLFYYGFALPNTYYAKVGTGVSVAFLWSHGIAYLLDAARADRLVLLVPLAAIAAALLARRARGIAVVAGIALYFVYLVNVGGDFMSGRFLTAPFVLAVGLLAWMDAPWNRPDHRAPAWVAAALLVIGLTVPRPTLLPDRLVAVADASELFDPSGVCDERGFYAPHTALSVVRVSRLVPQHPWSLRGRADRDAGRRVTVQSSVGFYGYFAGPGVHVVDPMALTDPLLARLPAGFERPRIGHYERRIPQGYLASLESGTNRIADPGVRAYYDKLRLIVSGPLLDPGRLAAIVAMNLGRYERFIDRPAFRSPAATLVPATWSRGANAETWLIPAEHRALALGGLVVDLPEPSHRTRVALDVAARGTVRASLMRAGNRVFESTPAEVGTVAPAEPLWITVPADVAAGGYDAIRVEALYSFDPPRWRGGSLADSARAVASAGERSR